jgi:F0F1-type ATP synthase membrane subunit c/vacuolar-type H+-ATPase subunit K
LPWRQPNNRKKSYDVSTSSRPGMFGKILTFMFVGMALAEGWAVIAWLVVK